MRLDFFQTYTEETERAAALLSTMCDQTYMHDLDFVHDTLTENGYKIHDFQFVGLIATIYRVGVAVGIRTERRRRRNDNSR